MAGLQTAVGLSSAYAGIYQWFLDGLKQGAERTPLLGPLPPVSTWSMSPQAPWIHLLGIMSEASTPSSLEDRQG